MKMDKNLEQYSTQKNRTWLINITNILNLINNPYKIILTRSAKIF